MEKRIVWYLNLMLQDFRNYLKLRNVKLVRRWLYTFCLVIALHLLRSCGSSNILASRINYQNMYLVRAENRIYLKKQGMESNTCSGP